METLSKHRGGLNAIARALLDNEIIDGAEVARLVDEAHGSPVHTEGAKSVPHFHEAAINAPAATANGGNGANGHGSHAEPGADATGGPVAVPAAPGGEATQRPEGESWPPPAWPPPADPAGGAPEGPAAR